MAKSEEIDPLKERSTYQKLYRELRTALGLCRDCGKNPLDGKARCLECKERHRALYRKTTAVRHERGLSAHRDPEEPGYKLQDDPKVQAEMAHVRGKWL